MGSSFAIPVAVVGDHTLLRNSLTEVINAMPGYCVALEAASGEELAHALERGVHVAVAIVDLQLPVMNGHETIAWLRANSAGTRILALASDSTECSRVRAMEAGACACILKDMNKQQFIDALEQVANVGKYLIDDGAKPARNGASGSPILSQTARSAVITERELLFIRLVCDEAEFTYDQIASKMGVHRRTVDGYRESVFHKLNVKTKAGLVLSAMRGELVS